MGAVDGASRYSLLSLAALGDLKQLSARLPALIEQARERDDLNAVVNFRTRLAYLPRLAADDMPLAIQEVREGIANWSRKSFTAQHYFELLASTDVALYAGDGAAAWSLVQRSWPDLEACLLLRVQSVRVEALSFLGRAAVAAASGNAGDRPRLLRAAERAVDKLRRDEGAHTAPLADIIAAGCAITRADQPTAIAMLERAAAGFEAADMSLHAAAALSARTARSSLINGQRRRVDEGTGDPEPGGDDEHARPRRLSAALTATRSVNAASRRAARWR